MLSRQVVDKLKKFETPFYFYDMDLLRQTLDSVVWAASKYKFKMHYAIKANYDPRILQVIKEYGLGIDCASGNEVRCAIEAGFDPKSIVYAGVGKRDKEIRYAIEQGIFAINCESLQELEVIDGIAAEMGKVVDCGLRVNPDIDPKTNHCIDTGQADSKFGISYEKVLEQAEWIQSLKHVNIKGMHLHIGSQIRELHVFQYLCDKVNVIPDNLVRKGFKLDFVDVGGGLGINYDMPENEPVPNFASVFAIINGNLKVGNREIHFEFGRSIVGECGELIRPMLYGSYHDIENLTSTSEKKEKYAIVGTACESTDVFNESVTLPKTVRGDILTIKSAGAYGMSMASRHNQHDLPGAVYSDDL